MKPYSVTVSLALIILLGITACGPGAQVLEQQQRQIAENQRVLNENRQRIQAEKNRIVQQQQPTPEELLEENRLLIIAQEERLARERQRAQDQQPDTADTLFVTHALALRAAAVAGSRAATDILANAPGTILLTDGADTDETLAVVWSPFFENAVVKFGRVGSPRPVALYYNPLLDVAVFTEWERREQRWQVASVRVLPGERLADPSAAVSSRPVWLESDEDPIEALSRIAEERLSAFRSTHPAQTDEPAPPSTSVAVAAADMQSALLRLMWNVVQRAEWAEEATAWLQPTLASIDETLNRRDAAALMSAAPDTDQETAAVFSDLPEGFAERLRLDMVLEGDEQERILIGSLPDDGDIYVFILCRLTGGTCEFDRFILAPLLG